MTSVGIMYPAWLEVLKGDPLSWLLAEETPAVRHQTLRMLLNRPDSAADVVQASEAAMRSDPIAAILAAQKPEGYWVKPAAGYAPKYRGTVWQLIFLDQLGADPVDARVRAACEYVISHTQSESGGFAASGQIRPGRPPSSSAFHCINGNLLRALLGFGWIEDECVQRAIDWQARSITGEGFGHYYASGTSGPGFCCAANYKLPCAWGAVKAMLALARIPPAKREPHVQRAIDQGAEFLLSKDPLIADYPFGPGSNVSSSWFKLGFPLGYVADVLQNLEALCEIGLAGDPRLQNALEWLLAKQDKDGRWRNEYAYNGKTWVDFERQGQPSKWVTLRACRVIKMAFEAGNASLLLAAPAERMS
ncbi:MAG TPA: nitrogen fixation protein NifH [Dehalococcoidia bacterium]|nr:nitrogen fixation protein NifH [Dehalococcoidia bacterium]